MGEKARGVNWAEATVTISTGDCWGYQKMGLSVNSLGHSSGETGEDVPENLPFRGSVLSAIISFVSPSSMKSYSSPVNYQQ